MEFEASGRKGVNEKMTDQKAPQTAVKGGAHGSGGEEFQFQNNTPNEGAVTGVTEVNADKTNLEGQSFIGGIANQGEYFAERINEIDKELKKFDLEKGNQGEHVIEETHTISDCLLNEAVEVSGISQNLGDTRELLSEPSPYVPLLSENPKEATPHEPLNQAKPIAKSWLQDTYVTPTWKRSLSHVLSRNTA
nr:hypothetical protein CFP56_03445 [Quercus suber]